MSTVYCMDLHNPVLMNSQVKYVTTAKYGELIPMVGTFPVSIPSDLTLDGPHPTSLSDLITQKTNAIKAKYPIYNQIIHDECVNRDNFTINPSQYLHWLGDRKTICFGRSMDRFGDANFLRSNMFENYGNSTGLILVEFFKYVTTNPVNGKVMRYYQELDPVGVDASGISIEISQQDDANWIVVQHGVPYSTTSALNSGHLFRIRFRNTSGQRIWLGSWTALLNTP